MDAEVCVSENPTCVQIRELLALRRQSDFCSDDSTAGKLRFSACPSGLTGDKTAQTANEFSWSLCKMTHVWGKILYCL